MFNFYKFLFLSIFFFQACSGCGDDDDPVENNGSAKTCEPSECGFNPLCENEALEKPVATQLNPLVINDFASELRFLVDGDNPVQTCVAEGVFIDGNLSVMRGKVVDEKGAPVGGVFVSIPSSPEFGQTITYADGTFDLLVNGGPTYNIRYRKRNYLDVDRRIKTTRGDFSWADRTVLRTLDENRIKVDFSKNLTVVQGSKTIDKDGERQLTALFAKNTKVEFVMQDGTVKTMDDPINVRVTEFTIGEDGLDSMPAPLPAASAYTYAVELSVDEARDINVAEVKFDKPVAIYVDNFLDFPTGTPVPAGYYDRKAETWKASDDGRVIRILDIVDGVAILGVDDETESEDARLAELGIDKEERKTIASQYEKGKSLWRVEVDHFTPWDLNWGASRPNMDPPRGSSKNKPDQRDPCKQTGSIIECENQMLGEILRIEGTPYALSYRSDRAKGGKTLEVELTDGDDDVTGIAWIELTITVAGQRISERFTTITQDMDYLLEWDGLDGYGRVATGPRTAKVKIKYGLKVNYVAPVASEGRSFGIPGGDGQMMGTSDRAVSVRVVQFDEELGQFDAKSTHAMGGWMLANRHVYDRYRQELYPGADTMKDNKDSTYIVSPAYNFDREIMGLPFIVEGAAPLNFVSAPDGSLFLAISVASQFGVQVIRFDPGLDRWEHIAGKIVETEEEFMKCRVDGVCGYEAGPTQAILMRTEFAGTAPRQVLIAISPIDQSVYYSSGSRCINRIKNKKIATIVGTCHGERSLFPDFVTDDPTDGIYIPKIGSSLAVDPDGNLYLAELDRVIKYDPDGKNARLYAGGEKSEAFFDGAVFQNVKLSLIRGLEFNAQGTIYVHDFENGLFRVEGDGRIRTIETSDLGVADLTASDTGKIYISTNLSIYEWDEDVLVLIAGGTDPNSVGRDERERRINGNNLPAPLFLANLGDMAVTSDGIIYALAGTPNTNLVTLRTFGHLFDTLPEHTVGKNLVPAEDGGALYVFDKNGQHLKTLNAIDGKVETSFEYNDQQRLSKVIDRDGLATIFNYTTAGVLENIVGPYGHKTEILINDGYLKQVTAPDGATWKMDYDDALGLLSQFTNPKGNSSKFEYSPDGKLIKDSDALNGFKTLARDGDAVTLTTAMGTATTYTSMVGPNGTLRELIASSGVKSYTFLRFDSVKTVTQANGTIRQDRLDPDPRFGMISPYLGETVLTLPSGKEIKIEHIREVELEDPSNLLSVKSMTAITKIDDREALLKYDVDTQTISAVSPEGRKSHSKLDNAGRVIEFEKDGLLPATFEYDEDGRLLKIQQGTRKSEFHYDEKSNIERVSDAYNQGVNFTFDGVGRTISQRLPDGRTHNIAFDPNGNISSIQPAGRDASTFDYDAVDRNTQYNPPSIPSVLNPSTSRIYDLDGKLTQITLSDGREMTVKYDQAGRTDTVTAPLGIYTSHYSSETGQIERVDGLNGGVLTFEYDGNLVTKVTNEQEGISGVVEWTYDNFFLRASQSVNGKKVSYRYDKDGGLLVAGALTLTRDPASGFVTQTEINNIRSTHSINGYGEVDNRRFTYNGNALFEAEHTYNNIGQITDRAESVEGVLKNYAYTYDDSARLTEVFEDGVLVESFGFDDNDNITERTVNGLTTLATFDAQDRLISQGAKTYRYNDHGQLNEIADSSGDLTNLQYDVFGALRNVSMPDGTTIDYIIDSNGLRVGKRVNGTFDKGWVYGQNIRPIAEVNAAGDVVSLFVYGSGIAPNYMVKGSTTYRLITDHLGSIRLVVNARTGVVAQQINYDVYGKKTLDTNPGFQPFGFAAGLHDEDTGLVQFSARDFDPTTARWTAKDPILFGGGQTNLYSYVANDPVNYIDPTGLYVGYDDALFVTGGVLLGLGGQVVGDLMSGKVSGWQDYAGSAIGGAAYGGALLYGGPLAAGIAGGVAGNLAKQGLYQLTYLGEDCSLPFDGTSLAMDAAFGAGTSFIPAGSQTIKGVFKGGKSIVKKQIGDRATKHLLKSALGKGAENSVVRGTLITAGGTTLINDARKK